jgi:hypothetical protein
MGVHQDAETGGARPAGHVVEVALGVSVGGIVRCRSARHEAATWSAEAAPMAWPIMDLMELTGMLYARGPNTRLTARVSIRS